MTATGYFTIAEAGARSGLPPDTLRCCDGIGIRRGHPPLHPRLPQWPAIHQACHVPQETKPHPQEKP